LYGSITGRHRRDEHLQPALAEIDLRRCHIPIGHIEHIEAPPLQECGEDVARQHWPGTPAVNCGQGYGVLPTRVTLGQLLSQEQTRLRPVLKSQMCHFQT
jgi:hypothetical protein